VKNLDIRVALNGPLCFAHRTCAVAHSVPSLAQNRRVAQDDNFLASSAGRFSFRCAGDDAQHFFFAHNDELFAIQLDFSA
jgi:hypothetical protein